MSWAAVNARARGLGSRRLPREEIAAARQAGAVARVAQLVTRRGFPLAPGRPGAAELEAAVRAGVAAELRALGRWLDPRRRAALGVLFAGEDRRSLRRIVRGLLSGMPLAERLAGTLPTPTLPAAALAELARQASAVEVAALLTAWGSPFGHAVASAVGGATPDLLRLELALDRVVAELAARAAARGDAAVRRLVARVVDGANAGAALLLAGGGAPGGGDELSPADCFLAGGRQVSRQRFLAAATSGSPRRAAELLAPGFDEGEAATVLASGETGGGRLERALLADQLAEQRRLALLVPASAATTLTWALALRHEAAALREAAWSAELAGGAAP
jgi:hypothetical protein